MTVLDFAILAVIGISMLMGMYRGLVATLLHTGGTALSFVLSFALYPRLAAVIRSNGELIRTLLHYTDASSRLGDLSLAVRRIADLSADAMTEVVQKTNLPAPFDVLLKAHLTGQVYGTTTYGSVSDYISQTILSASINILCFLVVFVALCLLLSAVINLLHAVFRFPLLKHLDMVFGALFGLLRGILFCYALFAVIPLVQSMLPDKVTALLLDGSTLAPIFNNGQLILAIMDGKI